jgi:long-chain acyl-CoA synthetase
VLGLPDAVRGKRVVAVLRLDESACAAGPIDHDALIARLSLACRAALEPYKLPRRWWIAAPGHWPQTRSGKTDHGAIAGAITRSLDAADGQEPAWLHATS